MIPVLRFPVIILLGVLLLAACDDADSEPPAIDIIAPTEFSQYHVYDTIGVHFSLADDRMVENFSLRLVNEGLISVIGQVSGVVGKTQHEGFAELVIDNRQLESGKYYVLVTASDGTNDSKLYREVFVNGLPFKRRAIYIADAGTDGTGALHRIDSLLSSIELYSMSGQDIRKVSINSALDRLNVLGKNSGGLMQYDLATGQLRWTASTSTQPQAATYHDMATHAGQVFVSLFDKRLRVYSENGVQQLELLTENDRPFTLYADDAHLLVERRQNGTAQNRLFVYRSNNYSYKHQMALTMQLVAICERNGNEVFLFGNENGQAKVWLYNVEANSYWEPRQLPEGRIYHAVKGSGQSYFLAHESGLYHYTFNPNFLNNIRPSMQYQYLCYDRADGLLLAAKGNSLDVMVGQNGAVMTTFAHTDSIVSMDIHYTR